VRAFYARADTWRPMLLGTAVALASIPLYLACGNLSGVRGLAIASVIGMSIGAAATVGLARWLHGAPSLAALCASGARAALIAAPAALIVRWIFGAPNPSTVGAMLSLGGGGAVYVALLAAGVALVGDAPLRELANRLLPRRLRGVRF
jgi:peptidoglycan biosynthesis protein MviN/MurJ (putative lipid II flippase)